MTTTPASDRRPAAPGGAPSQWTIAATIWARAVADLTTIVGALAFYGLALGVAVGALWPPLKKTFASLSAAMPAAIDRVLGDVSMASPAGWMNAEMMSIMAPAFLVSIAVISAGRAGHGHVSQDAVDGGRHGGRQGGEGLLQRRPQSPHSHPQGQTVEGQGTDDGREVGHGAGPDRGGDGPLGGGAPGRRRAPVRRRRGGHGQPLRSRRAKVTAASTSATAPRAVSRARCARSMPLRRGSLPRA